jgi:uncharacterized Fe-S cluster protein YjdI/CDGSH-type Zn-finger protein
MSKPTVKEYTDKDLTVVWKPELCIHSEKCFHGLSAVFDPDKRPWINMDGAENKRIVEQVKQCPSGALSYYHGDEPSSSDEAQNATITQVEVIKNGPLIVQADIEIKMPGGEKRPQKGSTALCRCGASSNKPFCDGSHKKVSFEG